MPSWTPLSLERCSPGFGSQVPWRLITACTMVARMVPIPSPKQPLAKSKRDWYPYYAGFTATFARSVIECHFGNVASVVDPWNGSGTTTTVGASLGLEASGIDINPALTVIARARNCPASIADSLEPLAREIAHAAERMAPEVLADDPLATWLRLPSVAAIRQLQAAIHQVLVDDVSLREDIVRSPMETVEELPLLAAFFYTALFAAAREMLRPFRGSNPAWIKTPIAPRNRLQPSMSRILELFFGSVSYLASRLILSDNHESALARIKTGSVLELKRRPKYGACLTSPPYATRIDYVKSSLPELSVLGVGADLLERLRRESIGTPVVRGTSREECDLIADTANRILSSVEKHESHGSANYYLPWLRNYFARMQLGLDRVARCVRHNGPIAVLVQDSYYKAHHVDVAAVVSETMSGLGRRLIDRTDFAVLRTMSLINPAARSHLREREHRESLLVFR